MKNHKLHSTVGEPEETEVKYPRMVKNSNNDRVILFWSRHEGVVLHKGESTLADIGSTDDLDAERMPYHLYNGPVTITGEDIN